METAGDFSLADYKKIQCIGKGGFGTVFLCRHPKFKTCVMKEVYIVGASEEDVTDISKEAGILSSLRHPHVVCYLSHAAINSSLYIVMEYAPNGDLDNYIASMGKHRDENEVLELFAQIVCGVSYIHEKNIIHRDICARNVLVCKGQVLKLSDFGLSRKIESVSSGGTKGNPSNFAPELCWGGKATKASDMWAVGCLLYYLATGVHAFQSPSLAGTVKLIVSSPAPALPTSFSHHLGELLMHLLDKTPTLRLSAAQLLAYPILAVPIHEALPRRLFNQSSPKKTLAALGFQHLL